jgi:acyl-coenzyme A thioesterase PaaI-like protein
MMETNDFVRLQSFTSDRSCFACGSENPFGLHMQLFSDGRIVMARTIVPGHLCGWGNLVHGGILTTLLDETMSWAAIHLLKKLILTRTMQVEFVLPVAPNTTVRTEGRIDQKIKNTEALVSASLFDERDQECVRATGRFALLSPKMMRRMKIMDERTIADFERCYAPV